MKTNSTIILFLLCFSLSQAQISLKKCYVREIGFTFYVPKTYKIFTPKPDNDKYFDQNNHEIKDKKVIAKLTKDLGKRILELETTGSNKGQFFKMSIGLVPITEQSKDIIGDSIRSKKFLLAYANQSGEKLDTVFTKIKIGTYNFNKSIIVNYGKNGNFYTCSYNGTFGDYYLGFSFECDDKKAFEDMISLIEAGKFDDQK